MGEQNATLKSEALDQYWKTTELEGVYKDADLLSVRYVKEVLNPFVNSLKEATQNPMVLDIGSGIGGTSRYLEYQGCKVVQTDISKTALQHASGDRVVSLAQDLPFAPNSFDGINMKDVLVHVDDLDTTLKKMYELLKPGGETPDYNSSF